MAIDPYKPELAKRKTAQQIATEQLNKAMTDFTRSSESDVRQNFTKVTEAIKDYHETAKALTEWMENKNNPNDTNT